jgi:hypothetical protein
MSHQPKAVTRNPQMSAHNAQMGGKHLQTAGGGNRPPEGQPQGKKKPGERQAAWSPLEATSNSDRNAEESCRNRSGSLIFVLAVEQRFQFFL